MRMPILLLVPLALAACARPGLPGPVALDQPQRAGRLLVTPIKVVEDSRCPDTARCAEPGEVVVRAVVQGGGFTQLERQFVLGRPVAVGPSRWLMLDTVEPGVSRELTAFTGPYRFHFSEVPPPPGG
jgi:hypothetical protein